jgi:hypothetical protein
MKRLTLWCLLAFLGHSRAAAEEQWEIGVERARIAIAPFLADRESRLPVEYTRQKGPQCLSTAAAMALRYYGVAVEPARLYELGKWDPATGSGYDFNDGSSFKQLKGVLARMDYHWYTKEFRADHNGFREGMVKINEQIALGHPVIVTTYFGYGEAHAVLLYGYDDLAQLVYILDSALPPPGKRVLTCDEFEWVWTLRTLGNDPWRRALFTLPKGEVPEPFAMAANLPSTVSPPPPPPSPTPEPVSPPVPEPAPTPVPSGVPEKAPDSRTAGGFQPRGSRSPLPATGTPNSGQAAGGRVILKPFISQAAGQRVILKPFLP